MAERPFRSSRRQRLSALAVVAGFQVSTGGRIWVSTEDLNTPRLLERIAEKLAARGHSSARIEKIIGGNFVRLMWETWAV